MRTVGQNDCDVYGKGGGGGEGVADASSTAVKDKTPLLETRRN